MNRLIYGCLLAMVWSVAASAQSTDLAPDALARKVTEEVLAIVRADKDIQAGNHKKILDLVEAKVLPHFNFTRMTRLAVGAPWRRASTAQQQSLTNEFRMLLVYTYTNAFTQYRDQVVEYKPLKLQTGDTDVVVRSLVKQKGGADPIDINYSMEKTDASWKVYDVTIAGVSLVQNYRSTFNSEIQKAGIDGLIATLATKNKTLAQQSARK
ncbi:MAG: ABC transporter substrate-binding protein [Betaproteobacteria bacterium]|nr:ABC transporter substrate-binding protein [Betaproteobacteria bacterium]MBI3055687.1 ABC transporter substrate-binding protein [Betaproteobacteria bacterium]